MCFNNWGVQCIRIRGLMKLGFLQFDTTCKPWLGIPWKTLLHCKQILSSYNFSHSLGTLALGFRTLRTHFPILSLKLHLEILWSISFHHVPMLPTWKVTSSYSALTLYLSIIKDRTPLKGKSIVSGFRQWERERDREKTLLIKKESSVGLLLYYLENDFARFSLYSKTLIM